MKFNRLLLAVLVLMFAVTAFAQSLPIDLNLPSNVYGAGVSYNVGGSPAIAGTGMYAHLLADTGTYAFTVVDILPNTQPKFTVSTNIGVGIAQKIAAIKNIPIYIPTTAGISIAGGNTGWAWSTGGMAVFSVKDNFKIMPNVRIVKSSVANGTGYQPIIGVMFGWGQ